MPSVLCSRAPSERLRPAAAAKPAPQRHLRAAQDEDELGRRGGGGGGGGG
jgi:hypothetical protein